MRDLTQGPITGNLVQMAVPIAVGMLAQTLYFLVDLYFVAQLGDAAIAGVSAAGIAMFIVMALTQTLGVGTVALVAQAVGRKDPNDANLVFNQSLVLAAICLAAARCRRLRARPAATCARSARTPRPRDAGIDLSQLVPAGPRAAVRHPS